MSTQNDLLDGNDSNLERLSNEAPEQSDMCLNWQDDVDNNFPNCEPDAGSHLTGQWWDYTVLTNQEWQLSCSRDFN